MMLKLLALSAVVGVMPLVAPIPAERRKKTQEFYDGRSALWQRHNGAKLFFEVKVATAEGKPDQIEFHWSLDYTGPRQPFTVLAPTLERATNK